MKLRVLNIADVKGRARAVLRFWYYVSLRPRANFPPISPGPGIKLLVEKESIEYTLPRDSTPPLVLVILKFRRERKDEESRGILPSPPEISQARISTFVHLCASRRPQSTCYTPPQHRKNAGNNCHFRKISTLTRRCARSKFSFSLPRLPFKHTSVWLFF